MSLSAARENLPCVESLEARILMAYTASLYTALNVDRSCAGAADEKIIVRFSGATPGESLNKASFDWQDLQVTSPGGFLRKPTFVSVTSKKVGIGKKAVTEYYATYSLAAPGGTWDASDGTYGSVTTCTISLLANQILDATGTAVAAKALGTFNVLADVWQVGDRGLIRGGHEPQTTVLTDPDGTQVTLKLKGPGTAIITDAFALVVNKQTAATETSSLGITTHRTRRPGDDGRFTLTGITTNNPLKLLEGRTTDLIGDVSMGPVNPGAIATIHLNDIAAGVWNIDTWTSIFSELTLQANHVTDVSITSIHPFDRIQVTDWLDNGNAKDTIVAPFINTIITRGDLEANLTLNGASDVGGVNSITLMQVGGWVRDSDIVAAGNLHSITVGGLTGSDLYVGVLAGIPFITASTADFASYLAIDRLVVKGFRDGQANAFVNSNVFAWTLGTISLKNVQPLNDWTPFGVVGHSIASYTRTLNKTNFYKNVTSLGPTVVDSLDNTDFVVKLV